MHTKRNWLFFFIYLAIILLSWLPVYLAFFPGICYYDLPTQIEQYTSHVFNASHPLLHTLILGYLYTLFDNPNTGMMIYSILQMILLASSMEYSCVYLYKRGINRVIRYLIIFLFAVLPLNSLLAISSTKDVVFAALMLFTLTYYLNLKTLPSKQDTESFPAAASKKTIWNKIVLSLLTVLTILFRNNAIYAFLAGACIILIYQMIKK